jgi:hydroxymethylpyrimidine pyrophosphatase-like HAD family hydrolase
MILFLDIDNTVLMPTERHIGERASEALRYAQRKGFRFVLHSTWRNGLLAEAHDLFETA